MSRNRSTIYSKIFHNQLLMRFSMNLKKLRKQHPLFRDNELLMFIHMASNMEKPSHTRGSVFKLPSGKYLRLDGRVKSCPDIYCHSYRRGDPTLVTKVISKTHAIKACMTCKRKFTYVRNDTKTGRKMANTKSARLYRLEKRKLKAVLFLEEQGVKIES